VSASAPGWTALDGRPFDSIAPVHRGRDRGIWRVRDARSGRTEILKLVLPDAPQEARRAIGEEFLLLDCIRHSNWVRALGFLHLDDGSCGYRMEDAGEPVSAADASGWFPRDLSAARDVLGALASLHALGIAHLDIKPSQILRGGGAPGATLIDPGLAAGEGSQLPARGTWGFIAPEILDGRPWDRRADFYALGCVLVELWTGENPLGDGEIAEQIRRQRSRPRLRLRERLQEIPEGLDRVVETFLDPDPTRRPANAHEAWTALHTMLPYADGYAEARSLPPPYDLAFTGAAPAEDVWERTLMGETPDRWVIDGPVGSGRHRMLARLRARAEVAGYTCASQSDSFVATRRPGMHAAPGEVRCRVGRPERGEHRVECGAIGARGAAAALEAHGLCPEGGEASWTPGLLLLRLRERVGAEAERRQCTRARRTIATSIASAITPADRDRLGILLAAEPDDPPLPARHEEPLAVAGLVVVDRNAALHPACPPWDLDSLRVIAGEASIAAAHRALLEDAAARPVAAAAHAVGGSVTAATLEVVPRAVGVLRSEGLIGRAFDLLVAARSVLGDRWPEPWAIELALLAVEDGAPSRSLFLRGPRAPLLPEAWRMLLDAQLQYRAGRRREAIATARAAQERTDDLRLKRAAEMIVIRSWRLLGELDAAAEGARRLIESAPVDGPRGERLRPAALLLGILSARGEREDLCRTLRTMCTAELGQLGPRERHEVGAALGAEAFQRGDFASARELMRVAVEAAAAGHDPINLAISQMNLAGVSFEEGRTAECEELNEQALRACSAMGLDVQAAHARRNLATVMLATGRLGEALALCRKARDVLGADPTSPNALATRAVESQILLEAGLLESARASLEEAAEILSSRSNPVIATVVWRDLARLEKWRGEADRAADLLEEAHRLALGVGASDDASRAWIEMAALLRLRGDLPKAARTLAEAEAGVRNSTSVEISIRHAFVRAMVVADREVETARGLLATAAEEAGHARLFSLRWRCHAAAAGLAHASGDAACELQAIFSGRQALLDMLDGVGPDAMRESYVMLPDPYLFLTWCDRKPELPQDVPPGSSDLEVFLR
jgi:tetratricopeptide (TPR) repeat protein